MVGTGFAAWLLTLLNKKVRNNEYKFKQRSGAVPRDEKIKVMVVSGFSVVPRNKLYTGFISGSGPRADTVKVEQCTLPDPKLRRLKKLNLDPRPDFLLC